MISIFNRRELTICPDLHQCEAIRGALDRAGIPCQVKTRDRSSPSALSFGTRERSGTFGQAPAAAWTYTIYVRRRDWAEAQACLQGR